MEAEIAKKVASKSPGFNIIEEYTLDEAINSTKQDINTTKVSPDAAGNVVTSGGVGKIATVHQAMHNDSVKETREIKSEESVSGSAASLHVVTGTDGTSAPTTEPEQTALTTPNAFHQTCKHSPMSCHLSRRQDPLESVSLEIQTKSSLGKGVRN